MPSPLDEKTIKPAQGSGRYVRVSSKGVVTQSAFSWMDPDGNFPKVPSGEKVEWLISKQSESEMGNNMAYHEQIAIRFPDTAVTTKIAIAGCILVCNDVYDHRKNKTNKVPRSRNMVVTARVGIPSAALATISQGADCPIKEQVTDHNGYQWLTVKIKNARENSPEATASESKITFTQRSGDKGLSVMPSWISTIGNYTKSKSNMIGVFTFSFRRAGALSRVSNESKDRVSNSAKSLFDDDNTTKASIVPELVITLSATLENVLCLGPTMINQPPINPILRDMCTEGESKSLDNDLLDSFMGGLKLSQDKLSADHKKMAGGSSVSAGNHSTFADNTEGVDESLIYQEKDFSKRSERNAARFEGH